MTRCAICSKDTPEGSRFCPFCGAKLKVPVKKNTDPLIGMTLDGKYEVEKQIGSGAMGSIYRARHTALSKEVALKVLHKHLVREESHIKRFHREARAASRLNHPNCITMLDFGQTEEGWFFICMEYVKGQDLCRILFDEGALTPERTVRIGSQVLDALDEAHSNGVIHRDLKPENIMLEDLRSTPDFVKVLDFGIAKIRDSDGTGDNSSFKTATGMVFGTPEYMSPEQICGEELDGRSDLYSLGVVLYQMLSGELPFVGDSVLEVATQHLSEPSVPLTEKRPDLPPVYGAVIDRFMAKKRSERFPDANEAKIALVGALEEANQSPPTRDAIPDEVFTRTTNKMQKPESEPSAAPSVPDQEEATVMLESSPILIPEDPRPIKPARSTIRSALLFLMILLSAGAVTFLGITLLNAP